MLYKEQLKELNILLNQDYNLEKLIKLQEIIQGYLDVFYNNDNILHQISKLKKIEKWDGLVKPEYVISEVLLKRHPKMLKNFKILNFRHFYKEYQEFKNLQNEIVTQKDLFSITRLINFITEKVQNYLGTDTPPSNQKYLYKKEYILNLYPGQVTDKHSVKLKNFIH
jgi:hypothetical protein